MPWVSEPSALPRTSAAIACQKPSPKKATAITPTKIVANSRLGALQVAISCHGEPCRRSSGIASIPPASTIFERGGEAVVVTVESYERERLRVGRFAPATRRLALAQP